MLLKMDYPYGPWKDSQLLAEPNIWKNDSLYIMAPALVGAFSIIKDEINWNKV